MKRKKEKKTNQTRDKRQEEQLKVLKPSGRKTAARNYEPPHEKGNNLTPAEEETTMEGRSVFTFLYLHPCTVDLFCMSVHRHV